MSDSSQSPVSSFPFAINFRKQMCKVVDENCRELVHAPIGSHHAASDLKNNLLPLEKIIEDVDRILSPQPNPTKEQSTSDSVRQPAVVDSPSTDVGLKSSLTNQNPDSEKADVATNMEVDPSTESESQKESNKSMQIDLDLITEEPEPSASHVPASEDPNPNQPESASLPERSRVDEMEVEGSKEIGAAEEHSIEGPKAGVIVLDD